MRTYSEQEVADIVARAAERQAAASRTSDGVGLTLDEIARLGADAGLDPDDLRAAAAEIDRGEAARQTSQTDTHIVAERWIDAPLAEGAMEDAVALIRERFGPTTSSGFGKAGGDVQQIGRTVEWSGMTGLGIQTTATLSPRGDRTRVRITQAVGFAAPRTEGVVLGGFLAVVAAVVAAMSLGAAVGLAAPLVVLATVAAFAATLGIAAPSVTAFDRRWRDRALAKLDALAEDVEGLLMATRPDDAPLPDAPRRDAPLRDAFEALEPDETEDAHDAASRSRGRA